LIAAVGLSTFNAKYTIAGWQYLLGVLAFAVLAVLGWRGFKLPPGRSLFPPLLLCLLGMVFDFLLVTILYTLSERSVPWYLILGSAIILDVGYVVIYSRMNWAEASSRHYFAAASGFVTGLLPLSFSLLRTQPGRVLNVFAELTLITILALTYRTLPRIDEPRAKHQT
jgi:membrane-associated PAP2 superfamily phosphatase